MNENFSSYQITYISGSRNSNSFCFYLIYKCLQTMLDTPVIFTYLSIKPARVCFFLIMLIYSNIYLMLYFSIFINLPTDFLDCLQLYTYGLYSPPDFVSRNIIHCILFGSFGDILVCAVQSVVISGCESIFLGFLISNTIFFLKSGHCFLCFIFHSIIDK